MLRRILKSKKQKLICTRKYGTINLNRFHDKLKSNSNAFAMVPLSMQTKYLDFLNANGHDFPIKYRYIKYYMHNILKTHSIHSNPQICEIDLIYNHNYYDEHALRSGLLEQVKKFYANFNKYASETTKNIMIKSLINGDSVARSEFQFMPADIKPTVLKEINNYSFDNLANFVFSTQEFNTLAMTKNNKFVKYTFSDEIDNNYKLKDGINKNNHIFNPYSYSGNGFSFTTTNNYEDILVYEYERSLTIPNDHNEFVKIKHGHSATATVINLGPRKELDLRRKLLSFSGHF